MKYDDDKDEILILEFGGEKEQISRLQLYRVNQRADQTLTSILEKMRNNPNNKPD